MYGLFTVIQHSTNRTLPAFAAKVSAVSRFVNVRLWFTALPIQPTERPRSYPIPKAAAGGDNDFAQALGAQLAQVFVSK